MDDNIKIYLKALIYGFIVLVVGFIITVAIPALAIWLLGPVEWQNYDQQLAPIMMIVWWLTYIVAGFVAGRTAGGRGWPAGFGVGAIVIVITIILQVISVRSTVESNMSSEMIGHLYQSTVPGLFTLALTGIGGWLGATWVIGRPEAKDFPEPPRPTL